MHPCCRQIDTHTHTHTGREREREKESQPASQPDRQTERERESESGIIEHYAYRQICIGRIQAGMIKHVQRCIHVGQNGKCTNGKNGGSRV